MGLCFQIEFRKFVWLKLANNNGGGQLSVKLEVGWRGFAAYLRETSLVCFPQPTVKGALRSDAALLAAVSRAAQHSHLQLMAQMASGAETKNSEGGAPAAFTLPTKPWPKCSYYCSCINHANISDASLGDYLFFQMSVIMILMFLLAWSPYSIVCLWACFGDPKTIPPSMAIIAPLFAKSSTFYNPCIYVAANKK